MSAAFAQSSMFHLAGRESGASFRTPRSGPESDLVQWFRDNPPVHVPRGSTITIFQEPRLESGFPDLVIVQWREGRTFDWRPERMKLKAGDIRILHWLYREGPAASGSLKSLFGRDVTPGLERLQSAKVAYCRAGMWKARPVKSIFAVEKIIAIEAKMEDIRGGLQQAFLNTWFASVSYLLTPHVPRHECIRERAAVLGVGLWSQKAGVVHEPVAVPVPSSYASWLFNEWVWRARFFFGERSQIPNEHRHSMVGHAVS
jgi:hypothetical protein